MGHKRAEESTAPLGRDAPNLQAGIKPFEFHELEAAPRSSPRVGWLGWPFRKSPRREPSAPGGSGDEAEDPESEEEPDGDPFASGRLGPACAPRLPELPLPGREGEDPAWLMVDSGEYSPSRLVRAVPQLEPLERGAGQCAVSCLPSACTGVNGRTASRDSSEMQSGRRWLSRSPRSAREDRTYGSITN